MKQNTQKQKDKRKYKEIRPKQKAEKAKTQSRSQSPKGTNYVLLNLILNFKFQAGSPKLQKIGLIS
jgi:hypothetical protein